MRWLRSSPLALVDADGAEALVVVAPSGERWRIRVRELDWIAFANIGESFFANENGWWLLGAETGAWAIWYECPVIDAAIRGPLAEAVSAVGDMTVLHMAGTPKVLRVAQNRGGVTQLCAADLDRMRTTATIEAVRSVDAVPRLP